MAHTARQQPSPHQSTNGHIKPTHHPSTLSSLLHTTLSTVLPLLFFTTFVIASTIVLSYSLSLNEPVPARFIVGVSAAFAALIGLSIWVYVWSRIQGVWKAGKRGTRQGDTESCGATESRGATRERTNPCQAPTAPQPEQPHARSLQWQQQQRVHDHAIPLPSRHSNGPIAHPAPAHPSFIPLPPRRGSIELSAIPERSIESSRNPFRPFTPYTPHHQHPAFPDTPRPPLPVPYRSPSVASLPESLRAPGRVAEPQRVTFDTGDRDQRPRHGQWHGRRSMRPGAGPRVSLGSSPSPAVGSGPGLGLLPMPRVPEPMRFGPSIMGRGEWEGGGASAGVGTMRGGDERRRLVKAKGRG